MSHPKVSIIVLNYNGLSDTIECIESLKKISYPNYEIVLVDNGSAGDDAKVLRGKYGNYLHVIENEKNYGFGGGNNIGMRYALTNSNPDYLLLLNNDTVVDPEFVTEMVKVAETDPAIGVAGAKVYYYDEPDRVQLVSQKIDLWKEDITLILGGVKEKILGRKKFDKGRCEPAKEVDMVSACCCLIKRKTVENIGFLDDGYFILYEDFDYCFRAKKAQYKIVYVPKAKVWHKVGRSVSKVKKEDPGFILYYQHKNHFRFMRKLATKWQYRSFLVFFFGVHLWLTTLYYLIWLRQPRVLVSFYKGVRDGLFNSDSTPRFYNGNEF